MCKGPNTTLDEGQTLIPSAVAGGVAPAVAGTLGVRGTRSHTELDGHGAHVIAPLPFDTTQVTNVANGSNPQPGDPCHPLTRSGNPPAVAFKASHFTRGKDGAPSEIVPPLSADADKGDRDTLVAAISFYPNMGANARSDGAREGVAGTLAGAEGGNRQAVAAPTLTSANDPSRSPQRSEVTQQVAAIHTATLAVRRLTPTECERLQGFPDGWTAIVYRGKPASDGPRYKTLGNSMAVNVMRWIGDRVSAVDSRS